ncbi:MAG: hypothetical protein ACREX9_12710 [Gammaproteobacteria bacterium]
MRLGNIEILVIDKRPPSVPGDLAIPGQRLFEGRILRRRGQ